MELWDLYDKGRAPLHRTHPRGAPLPEGAYHVAVEVAVFNPQGEVLLTRRAPERKSTPAAGRSPGARFWRGRTPSLLPAGSFGRKPASGSSPRS